MAGPVPRATAGDWRDRPARNDRARRSGPGNV